jgi:hypothetical protein
MSNISISGLNPANEIRDISDRELEIQGGRESTFHPAKVTIPDIKLTLAISF